MVAKTGFRFRCLIADDFYVGSRSVSYGLGDAVRNNRQALPDLFGTNQPTRAVHLLDLNKELVNHKRLTR
jgi:hypothetical protein